VALTKQQKEVLCEIINANELCVMEVLLTCERRLGITVNVKYEFDSLCDRRAGCMECFKEFFKLLS